MGTKSKSKSKTATDTRGRGRPAINPPDFTERFMIRATPADLDTWRAEAAKHGLSVSPWLRMIANKEIARIAKVNG